MKENRKDYRWTLYQRKNKTFIIIIIIIIIC